VVEEDFAMAGEVILFQGGGCEDGFGVEEAGKLRYIRASRFSSKSWMVASVSFSSSVGLEGRLDTAANWEYL